MAFTDISARVADDWYLVTDRNNLTIKIVKYITVGESDGGMLVLDSRVEDERWLTLEVDPEGCLNVVYQDPRCRLTCPDRWVADSAGAVLPRCTMLELPNNKLYVSQQLQRGSVEHTVLVSCENLTEAESADQFILPPLPEPSPISEQAPAASGKESAASEKQAPAASAKKGAASDQNLAMSSPEVELEDDLEPAAQLSAVAQPSTEQSTEQSRLAQALENVAMAPDVLDEMLRRLEEPSSDEVSAEPPSKPSLESNHVATDFLDADADADADRDNDKSRKKASKDSLPHTAEDIPVLKDVANVYALEVADDQVSTPHVFEVVVPEAESTAAQVQRTQSAVLDTNRDASADVVADRGQPVLESVYAKRTARPGQDRSGRFFAVALALVLFCIFGIYFVQQQFQAPPSDSPFKVPLEADALKEVPPAIPDAASGAQETPGAVDLRTSAVDAAEGAAPKVEAEQVASEQVGSKQIGAEQLRAEQLGAGPAVAQDLAAQSVIGEDGLGIPATPASSSSPASSNSPASSDAIVPMVSPDHAMDPAMGSQTWSDTQQIEQLLIQAERQFQAGYIHWGEPNTVGLLQEVLAIDPEQLQALELLESAAAALLLQAKAAHTDGFRESAVSLLEEILDFYPTYQPALRQLQDWQSL